MVNSKKVDRCKRRPLTIWDRQYILQMKERGLGFRKIARLINRSHSVVSRFLNSIPYSPYIESLTALEKAKFMDDRARSTRKQSRTKERLKTKEIRDYVEEKLKLGWSPELIAGRLSLEHSDMKTNYESIYQWIYKERKELLQYLVVAGKGKRAKRASARKRRYKQPAAPKTSIEKRPEIVKTRDRFGDWEGDTIVSRKNTSSIFNATERKTRYMKAKKIKDCTSASGTEAIIDMLSELPPQARHTITLDNGPENSGHKEVEQALEMNTYFCHPYCASERGTVENRNGFLRRFYPKKTDFATVDDEHLQQVQDIHNNRPMKCLGFKTPYEAFTEEMLTIAA